MLESPHVFVGAAIATRISNPLLALPLSLASHFVLDMIPHWNPHINREIKKYGKPTTISVSIIVIDSVAALIGGSLLAVRNFPNNAMVITVFLACFLSVLPDVVEIPYYFLGQNSQWAERWIKWQKSIQNDAPIVPGILSQIVVIVASLVWIFA